MGEIYKQVHLAIVESKRRKQLQLSRSYVFVLMPFAKKFDDIYQFAIKQPLTELGLKCERVDEIQFTGDILDQVYRGIRRASIIVADMTGKNPNVFYEVGFAHALGKQTVLLTQKVNDIPFDLRGKNHIVYGQSIMRLKKSLIERVQAILEDNAEYSQQCNGSNK